MIVDWSQLSEKQPDARIDAVFIAFAALTGIEFRIRNEEQKRLALTFANAFTLAELETVIEWTKKEIQRPGSKFSRASLQWHVVFGTLHRDECQTFQQRLGLANEETKSKRWRPTLALSKSIGTVPAPAPQKPAPEPVSPAEQSRIAEAVKRQQADFLAAMNRA